MEQLNALAGLDVAAFMPCGAEPGTASAVGIEKQFAILADVLLLVIGRDMASLGERRGGEKLPLAFQVGIDMGMTHGKDNHHAIQTPVVHKASLEDWSKAVPTFNLHEPP